MLHNQFQIILVAEYHFNDSKQHTPMSSNIPWHLMCVFKFANVSYKGHFALMLKPFSTYDLRVKMKTLFNEIDEKRNRSINGIRACAY